jgi:hypothetical protein
MEKILIEIQRMAIRDKKQGQDEALAIQFQPHMIGFNPRGGRRQGRGFA